MGIYAASGLVASVKVVEIVRRSPVRLFLVKLARPVVSGRIRHEKNGVIHLPSFVGDPAIPSACRVQNQARHHPRLQEGLPKLSVLQSTTCPFLEEPNAQTQPRACRSEAEARPSAEAPWCRFLEPVPARRNEDREPREDGTRISEQVKEKSGMESFSY